MPGVLEGNMSEIHRKNVVVLLFIGTIMEFGPSVGFGFFLRRTRLE